MPWTEQEEWNLKTLLESGRGLTAPEIAEELGTGKTKNAIIGKAHRLGFTIAGKKIDDAKVKVTYTRRTDRPRGRPGGVKNKKPWVPREMKDVPLDGTPVHILDLPMFGRCRHVLDPISALLYCGRPTVSIDSSWCKDHYRVFIIKVRPRSETSAQPFIVRERINGTLR